MDDDRPCLHMNKTAQTPCEKSSTAIYLKATNKQALINFECKNPGQTD